jgi:hypothetical protein
MKQTVSLVKVALGGLWCRLSGSGQEVAFSDEARERFDREYDAILAEMARSSAAANAGRRTGAGSL